MENRILRPPKKKKGCPGSGAMAMPMVNLSDAFKWRPLKIERKELKKSQKRKGNFNAFVRVARSPVRTPFPSLANLPPLTSLSLVYRVIAFRLASKYCSLGHDNKAACPNPQHPLQQSSARCSHTFLLCLCFSFSIDKINYTIICHASPTNTNTHVLFPLLTLPLSLSVYLCLSLSQSLSVSVWLDGVFIACHFSRLSIKSSSPTITHIRATPP